MPEILELLPESPEKVVPFFTPEGYEAFRERYIEAMRPQLRESEEARRRSEEESRRRFIG